MKNYILALALMTHALTSSQEISFDKIHNAVLTEFYKSHYGKITDLVAVNKQLLRINQELYPQQFSTVADTHVEQFTRALYGTTQLTMFSYKSRAIENINYAVVNGIYSGELAAVYRTFIDTSPKKKMVLAILKKFTSHPRSDQDLKSVALFKTAYLAADRFWLTSPVRKRARCNPNQQLRIADCAGAVFGATIGSSVPGFESQIGAVVGAQGMAVFVAAQHENNSGKCI